MKMLDCELRTNKKKNVNEWGKRAAKSQMYRHKNRMRKKKKRKEIRMLKKLITKGAHKNGLPMLSQRVQNVQYQKLNLCI